MCDARKGSHGAGKDDHGMRRIRAAGNVGADIRVPMMLELGARSTEEAFDELIASGQVELLGEDAQSGVGGDEVNVCDAFVGGKETEHLGGEEAAAGSGDGKGQGLAGIGICRVHRLIIRLAARGRTR